MYPKYVFPILMHVAWLRNQASFHYERYSLAHAARLHGAPEIFKHKLYAF
jgi:hypothetical protein